MKHLVKIELKNKSEFDGSYIFHPETRIMMEGYLKGLAVIEKDNMIVNIEKNYIILMFPICPKYRGGPYSEYNTIEKVLNFFLYGSDHNQYVNVSAKMTQNPKHILSDADFE